MRKLNLIFPVVLTTVFFLTPIYAQSESLPNWMKNTAGFWSQDQISDTEFISFIQFLIDERIITIPHNDKSSNNPEATLDDECNAFYYDMVKLTSYLGGLEQRLGLLSTYEEINQDESIQRDLENVREEIKKLQKEHLLEQKEILNRYSDLDINYCQKVLTKTQIDTMIFLDEGTIT